MAILKCSKTMQVSIVLTAIVPLAFFSYILLQTDYLRLRFNDFCQESCPSLSNPAPNPITSTFERIQALEDLSGNGDIAWSTQMSTPKGGFLRVRRNETLIENWGISVFHALHCLGIIRDALRSLEHHPDSATTSNPPSHHHGQDTEHTLHCLSYLAQV